MDRGQVNGHDHAAQPQHAHHGHHDDEQPVDDRLVFYAMQRQLVELELYRVRRELYATPGLVKVNIGAGWPVEQTIDGNQQDPYNGVVIYNPTPATLSIGFEAGTALLAPATVPPYSWASFPERFVNLSIATLLTNDQAAVIPWPVTAIRLRIPPTPAAGPLPIPGPGNGKGPLTSLQGASALATGLVLDHGVPLNTHSLFVVAAAGTTGGVVAIDVSSDNVNWFLGASVTTSSAGTFVASYTVTFRYIRARITTAIVGGTITAIVSGA